LNEESRLKNNLYCESLSDSNSLSNKNSPSEPKFIYNKSGNKNQRLKENNNKLKCMPTNQNVCQNSRQCIRRSNSRHSDSSESDKKLSMRELACSLRDAVVSISGQSIFTLDDGTESLITQNGNGFFIKGHYIICPADLILISPIILESRNRSPEFNTKEYFQPVGNNNKYLNAMIRVSKILVDVSNVNGSGKSYSYEADIIGIDGAANVAVLRIATNNEWNQSNPSIHLCHPFLQWGKSRSSCPGDTIIAIGNISAPANIGLLSGIIDDTFMCLNNSLLYPGAENGVVIGNISDNRYVFPGGQVPGELLLLSNIMTKGFQRGLPVITLDGTIIGMTLFINSSIELINHHKSSYLSPNYNIALSEFFMRRPVKALIRSYQDNCIPDHYKGFIEKVSDPISDYYRFNKACLGISGILMGQEDFNTKIQNVAHRSTSDDSKSTPHIILTRIPFSRDFFIKGPKYKELVGYRLLYISRESPLFKSLSIGDIITHINGCPLGDRKGQISPSLVMWRVRPGEIVTIQYKKQNENFDTVHEINVCVGSYEPFMDFPFYGLSIPSLSNMFSILM
jgi:hypothetical protein